MLVTEQQAERLWCPHIFDSKGSAKNVKCIASSCMSWRWHCVHPCADWPNGKTDRGYCGLSGKPEARA